MSGRDKFKERLTFILFCFCISSCNFKDNKLKDYYQSNIGIHQQLSDSLMYFCKRYQTEIKLKRTNLSENKIMVDVSFPDSASYFPIFFDSSYRRQEDKPELTGKFVISKDIISDFDKSLYLGISADSNHCFFVLTLETPAGIGTRPDVHYGIFISPDTTVINKSDKRISNNAIITTSGGGF